MLTHPSGCGTLEFLACPNRHECSEFKVMSVSFSNVLNPVQLIGFTVQFSSNTFSAVDQGIPKCNLAQVAEILNVSQIWSMVSSEVPSHPVDLYLSLLLPLHTVISMWISLICRPKFVLHLGHTQT